MNDIDKFIDVTKKDLEKKINEVIINKKILSVLKDGKRLRPLIAMMSFKSCTQGKEDKSLYQDALEGFLVIELAHTASLLHDDIIDQDKERRGKPSYYASEGMASAFLLGHIMLAIGLKISLKHGNKFSKLYAKTWNDVVDGEFQEIIFNKDKLKEGSKKQKIFEIYNKIIEKKTAVLFAASCESGALKSNATDEITKLLSDYGREIGIAYQLSDDFVDLEKGEMLDSVIIPLLNRLEDDTIIQNLKTAMIKKYLKKHKEEIKRIFLKEINKHIEKAKKIAKSELIPLSEYKDMLLDLPLYIVNKILKEINMSI